MSDDRGQFGALYLTKFASSFGFITVLTLLPKYIDLLNPSGVVIGLFVTALALARAAAVIPLGWAGDRYDKRTVLMGALAVSAGAYVAFAMISSSAGFVGARVLQGLGMVGTGLLGLALVGELAPEGDRANVIGKYNAVRMAAGVAGTLGAGVLFELYGFEVLFGLLAGLMLLALLSVWRFVDADGTSVPGFAFADLALNRRLLTLASFRSQYAIAVTLVRNWIPIYVGVSVAKGGLGASAVVVGAVIAAEKLTNMLTQPHTGRLSDRYGRAPFVFVGGGLYGLVALAVPFAPAVGSVLGLGVTVPRLGPLAAAVPVLVLANACLGVADGFREPASMALFADEGAGRGITSSFGVRNLVWYPGSIAAPMLGGVLMTDVGMAWIFYLGGAIALSGALTFLGVLSYAHGPRGIARW